MIDKEAHFSAKDYWERRYAAGGNSGAGSGGILANYKAAFLNRFIKRHDVNSVIDFGCGDGEQIAQLRVRRYLGLDISPTALARCRILYADRENWRFRHMSEVSARRGRCDLALSLDVVYHLVDDTDYQEYMQSLFAAARKYVIVYGSDWNAPGHVPHIRHRWFSGWVACNRPEWSVAARPANPYPFDEDNDVNTTFASFVVFASAKPK